MDWRKRLTVILSLFWIVACGGPPTADDGGADGGAETDSASADTSTPARDAAVDATDGAVDASSIDLTMPTSVVELEGFSIAIMCERFFDCCGPPTSELAMVVTTEQDCRNLFGLAQFEHWNQIIASERMGRVELDVEAAHACLSAHVALGCDIDPRNTIPTEWDGCAGVVIGHVLMDAACEFDEECETGFCPFSSDDGPRTCQVAPTAGEVCIRRCAEGSHCVEAVCELDRAAGESCVIEAECSGACVDGVCVDDALLCDSW